MIEFCEQFSAVENATFSLNYPFVTIAAIIIGAALLFALISKFKFKPLSLIPFVCSVILLFGAITVYENHNSKNLKATYINASSVSEAIVLSNGNEVVICDLSNGSMNTYTKVLNEVYNARATEIRAIMMTGYTHLHYATYYELFASEIVREVWLPYPENADEYYKMNRICEVAGKYGVDPYVYRDGDTLIAFSNTRIQVFQDRIDRSAVPITLIDVSTPSDKLVYVSPAFSECEIQELTEELFMKADLIVLGHKGPRVKTDYMVKSSHGLDAIVFSSRDLIAHCDTSETRGSAYFYAEEKIELYLDK